MPEGIKNIIFDLGGVIINLSYAATSQAFKNAGVQNFDDIYSKAHQNNLFDELDKGFLSPEAFCEEVRRLTGLALSNGQIYDAWNAMLLDIPAERLALIHELKKKYNIYLLSNTNKIHVEQFSKYIDQAHGLAYYFDCFHKTYYSCDIGMRKPDREIFEFVLKENNLNAAETFFIDDSIQHIKGAEPLGIKTYLLDVKKESILDVFRDF